MARLPAGQLVDRLSAGGDLAEGYVLAPEGILRVTAGRPFRTEPIASSQAAEGALVPAPGLTQYVGGQTVLIVRFPDGSLAGYQAGKPLWQAPVSPYRDLRAAQLVQAGDLAFVGPVDGGTWLQLKPETGATAGVAGKPPCSPGPVAGLKGGSLFYCYSTGLLVWVPAQVGDALPRLEGRPWALKPVRREEVVLLWPDGTWYHVNGSGNADRHGRVPAYSGRPALAPDGSHLYLGTGRGVAAVPLGGGGSRVFGAGGATAVATSRDGNFVYALTATDLRVYDPSGSLLKTYARGGQDIELVAGG
ncbi:MAG TPA: hypothetical protein VK131_03540 [Candidatus Acidoferrales bacterium]|nr:hypothetical protein [Candidatus Acidoferrales bacterium]